MHLCIILFIHLCIIVCLNFMSTCNSFHLTSYLPLFLTYFSDWSVIWIWLLPHCADWLLSDRFLRQPVFSLVFRLEASILVLFLRIKMEITTPLWLNKRMCCIISFFHLKMIPVHQVCLSFTLIVHLQNLNAYIWHWPHFKVMVVWPL